MKLHESGENYLETILTLGKKLGNVRSIDIANELGFSKPSVSVAIKNFKQNELVYVDDSGYITLSPEGKAIAEEILDRHNTFLQILLALGVSEDNANADACKLEHVVSEESYQKIKSCYQQHSKK